MTLILPIDLPAAIVSLTCHGQKVQFKPPSFAEGWIKTQRLEICLFLLLFSFLEAKMKRDGVKDEESESSFSPWTLSSLPFLALV